MKEKQIEYLYKSLDEKQSTIKAIDRKFAFISIVVFLPLLNIMQIADTFNLALSNKMNELIALAFFIIPTWTMSLLILIRGVMGISNPNTTIKEMKNRKYYSSYFLGGQYIFNFLDSLFNFPIMSKSSIEDLEEGLPKNNDQLIKSLLNENLKSAYIRDLKIHRLKYCYVFSIIWIFLIITFISGYKFS